LGTADCQSALTRIRRLEFAAEYWHDGGNPVKSRDHSKLMSLGSGVRLGPYEILAPIGAGGMGEVYKAKDTRLDRTVAIKVLPGHVSSDPVVRERFEREARTVAALNHPHICTLHDVGRQDGVEYLVLEYLAKDRRWPIV
jgi:serine/threonine protein kinase